MYAEDPDHGFLPTGGTVLTWHEPTGPGIRVDSGIDAGTVVGSDYDPMLAKIIAHGDDRAEALRRLDSALGAVQLLGVTTNVGFLRALIDTPEVRSGELDTGLVERRLGELVGATVPDEVFLAAALTVTLGEESQGPARSDPWGRADSWRLGGSAENVLRFAVGPDHATEVRLRSIADGWTASIDGVAQKVRAELSGTVLTLTLDGALAASTW